MAAVVFGQLIIENLVEPYSALTTHLIGIFHQQSQKAEREAEKNQQGKHHPATVAYLLEQVGPMR
jgi:hypothetical protein